MNTYAKRANEERGGGRLGFGLDSPVADESRETIT